MEESQITQEHIEKHVHARLKRRLEIYFVLSGAIIAAILFRIISYDLSPWFVLTIFILGTFIGVVVSRMYKISWDKDAKKVISRLDFYGSLIFVAYIIFEIFGERYIKEVFQGPLVTTLILAFAGGALLGRSVGVRGKMRQILSENVHV